MTPAKAGTADLLLHNGQVLTGLDPETGPEPTAVAIRGDRILAVGESAATFAGPATEVIDLDGGCVLPGVNDAHLHFVASSMVAFGHVDVSARVADTWEGVRKAIETSASGADGWVRAHGWDATILGPPPDEVIRDCSPDRPVVVFDQTGHQLLANRKAMAAAGLGATTPEQVGGVVGRDASGEPTGLLQDGAMELVTGVLPEVPRQTLRSALLRMQAGLHAQGITSLTEPGLGPGSAGLADGSGTTSALHLLGDLAQEDELTLRMSVLLLFAGTGGVSSTAVANGLSSGLDKAYLQRGIDPHQLRIAGVKIFADGIPRSQTAWMREPYGDPCAHGSLVVTGSNDAERVAELRRILQVIDQAGLQAGIHATGDAATETAVEQLEDIQRAGQMADHRHYIIHGAFSAHSTLKRMAESRIGYSTNPLIRAGAAKVMRAVLGAERFDRHQPLASANTAGVRFNLASDSPVASTDWRRTIVTAVTRNTAEGPGRADDPERISGRVALSAMTALPAWQDHAESYKGTLGIGKVADLCVLDGPWPDDANIDQLNKREVILTIAGGRRVHDLISG
ncbi:amidohydrolase [Arthrobacter pigmenti]